MKHTKAKTVAEGSPDDLISKLVNIENSHLIEKKKSKSQNSTRNISDEETPSKKTKSKHRANVSIIPSPVIVKFDKDTSSPGLLPAPVKVKNEEENSFLNLNIKKEIHSNTASKDEVHLNKSKETANSKSPIKKKNFKEPNTNSLISSLVNSENKGLAKKRKSDLSNSVSNNSSTGTPLKKKKSKSDSANTSLVPLPVNVKFEKDKGSGLLPAPVKVKKEKYPTITNNETSEDEQHSETSKEVTKSRKSKSPSEKQTNLYNESKEVPTENLISSLVNLENRGLTEGLTKKRKTKSTTAHDLSDGEPTPKRKKVKADKAVSVPHPINVKFEGDKNQDSNVGLLPAPMKVKKTELDDQFDDESGKYVREIRRSRSTSSSDGEKTFLKSKQTKTGLDNNVKGKKNSSSSGSENDSDSNRAEKRSLGNNMSDSSSGSKDQIPLPKNQSMKTRLVSENIGTKSLPLKQESIKRNGPVSDIVNSTSSSVKQRVILSNTNNSDSSSESEDSIPDNKNKSMASSKKQRNNSDSEEDSQLEKTNTMLKNGRLGSSPEKRSNIQTYNSESENSSGPDDNNKTKETTPMANNFSNRFKSKVSPIKQRGIQRNTNKSRSSSESDNSSTETKQTVENIGSKLSPVKQRSFQKNVSSSDSSSEDNNRSIGMKPIIKEAGNDTSRVRASSSPVKQKGPPSNTHKYGSSSDSDDSSTETKQTVENIGSKLSPVKRRSFQKNVSSSDSSSEDNNRSIGMKPIIKDAAYASSRVRPSLSPVKQKRLPSNIQKSDSSSEDENQLPEPKQENEDMEYERHSKNSFKMAENWIELLKQRNADLKQQTINLNIPLKHAKYSLFRIPKNIDPNQLKNLKCSFNKEVSVLVNDRDYMFQPLDKNSEPILIISNGLHLINLDKIVVLQKSEPLKVVKKIKVVQRENIPLPDEIKQRHPLFGFDYKKKYKIKKEVKNKIQEAVDNKIRQVKKAKKPKKKVKKEKDDLVYDEQHLLDLLNLNNIAFSKPKGKKSSLNNSDNLVIGSESVLGLSESKSREKKHKKKKDRSGMMNNSEMDVSEGISEKKKKRSHEDSSEQSKSSKKYVMCL